MNTITTAFANNFAAQIAEDILLAIDVAFTQAVDMQEFCKDFDMETAHETAIGRLFLAAATEKWEEKLEADLLVRLDKKQRKVARRATYVNSPELAARGTRSGTASYRFTTGFASAGLMALMMDNLGFDQEGKPVVANLINRLPEDDRGRRPNVPLSEADNFNDAGYQFVQGQTLWSDNAQVQSIFDKCLPTAIDFGSYHSRFRASVIPSGYIPNVSCSVKELRDNRGTKMGADGSGLYDPSHPDMAEIVGVYGPVIFQFTAVNPLTGELFKGLLVPREGLNSCLSAKAKKCAIQFDYLQCKGAHKSAYKKLAKKSPGERLVLDGMHIGVMKAKTSFGKVAACFETLECIKRTPRTMALSASLIKEAIEKLVAKGPDGLLATATKSDLDLRRLAEFIAFANAQGADIDPLSIPHLRAKLDTALGKRMWKVAQGAGIRGKYPMVVIDDTLPKGKVVIAGYKKGTRLACWRFPTILSQSLLVLEVVGGKSHHKVGGKLIPNCIFMNSHDITVCQQGDDDGDEVGVTDDPRVIELFENKDDDRIYHIEPSSEKFTYGRTSAKGKMYTRKNPMGPIGPITMQRASQKAVNAQGAALASAVGCQEGIDSAKNHVRMTCPYKAADLDNWYKDANGEYHIHYFCDKQDKWLTDNWASEKAGAFDLEIWKEFNAQTMIKHGCKRVVKRDGKEVVKAGWPLGWRTQTSVANDQKINLNGKKTIALNNWLTAGEKQDGDARNLVHFCHDLTRKLWHQNMDKFTSSQELPAKDVLKRVLHSQGASISMVKTTIGEYYGKDGLREKAGLTQYAKQMKAAMGSEYTGSLDAQSRMAAIDAAKSALELQMADLSAQELYTIWNAELTPTEWYKGAKGRVYCPAGQAPEGEKSYIVNKPHYAFMVVSSKHSAIMRMLGMEASEACGWAMKKCDHQQYQTSTRIDAFVGWCRRQPDSFKALTTVIHSNKSHGEQCHDENGNPVRLADCSECCEKLETALVRAIRSDKTAAEEQFVKGMVTNLNRMDHESYDNLRDPFAEEGTEVEAIEDAYLMEQDPFAM